MLKYILEHILSLAFVYFTYVIKASPKVAMLNTAQTTKTSHRGLHPSGLQIGGNLRVLDRGCSVVGVTLSSQIL